MSAVRAPRGARSPDANGRWSEILDVAARLFTKKGYESTTMREIAEECGILAASLYYYIRTKEDLLYALIEETHREGREWLADPPIDESDPRAALRETVYRHVEYNARNPERAGVFYVNFHHLDPERRAYIADERDEYEKSLAQLIRRGQRDGELRPDLDARMVAIAILTLSNSVHQWYRPGRRWTPAKLAKSYTELVLGGLEVPTGEG